MLSLFYSTSDIKIAKNVHLTVLKPESGRQTILVKGKLGQFLIEWNRLGMNVKKSPKSNGIHYKTMLWPFDEGVASSDLAKKRRRHVEFSKETPHIFERRHIFFKESEGKLIIKDTALSSSPSSFFSGYPISDPQKVDLSNYWISTWPRKIENGFGISDSKLKVGFSCPFNVVSEKTNSKKEVVASQKESFHNVESLREIGLTRKEYYNRYRGKLLSFARQLRSSMKGITQGYTLNLRLEGVGFEAKGLTVDITIQENLKRSLIEELDNNSKTSEIEDRIHGMKKKSWSNRRKKSVNLFKVSTVSKKDSLEIKKKKESLYDFDNECGDQLKVLKFNLGRSHSLVYQIPWKTVTISKDILMSTGIISIFSISLAEATQVAADIRRYRKVEAYKGKGIKFDGEVFTSKKEK